MTAKNHRICHEIQNKRIVPVSGGPLYLLCSSKAATTTTTGRNLLWCFSFMANPMIFRCHYKFPYIALYLESPHPSPQAWAAEASPLCVSIQLTLSLTLTISSWWTGQV